MSDDNTNTTRTKWGDPAAPTPGALLSLSEDFLDSNYPGAYIRGLREKAGVSQAKLAELFGWQRDAIAEIEKGITDVSLRDYRAIIASLKTYFEYPTLVG